MVIRRCGFRNGFSANADTVVKGKKDGPILVELFTSQNCPACPTANDKLIELSRYADIFPLTWSVSYWDYLGWKDTYAKPAYNARQKSYADRFDLRGPYTPQTVVDGCVETSGRLSVNAVNKKIDMTRQPHGHQVKIKLTDEKATLSALDSSTPLADVWLVGFKPGITEVQPTRGANAGKALEHINMVTSLDRLGEWDGKLAVNYSYKCPGEACVIIVQEATAGDILAFQTTPGSLPWSPISIAQEYP